MLLKKNSSQNTLFQLDNVNCHRIVTFQQKREHPEKNTGPEFSKILRRFYQAVLHNGLKERHKTDHEIVRQFGLINAFGFIGLLYLGFMTGLTYLTAQYQHTYILLPITIIIAFLVLYLKKTGKYLTTSNGFLLIIIVLCVYLTSTGGVDNNGHLWTFMFPPLLTYMFGEKKGFYSLIVSILLMGLILFWDKGVFLLTDYTVTFKIRYQIAFLGLSLISLIAEHSRKSVIDKLITVNSHLQEVSLKLEKAALTDPLTNLQNRRAIYKKLEYELLKAERNKTLFSILIVDIDHFKKVNDNYGHDCGDEVLKALSRLLTTSIRRIDNVCRWGGEEFLILLPETNQQGCRTVAEKIRTKVEDFVLDYQKQSIKITISIGAETCRYSKGMDIDSCIKKADEKLYLAKERGRNMVVDSFR